MTDLSFVGQLIGWLLSSALGILFVRTIIAQDRPILRGFTLVAGPAIGFGISSLVWFLVWCRGGSGSPLVPLAAEFILLLFLLRSRLGPFEEPLPDISVRKRHWLLIPIALSLFCALFHFQRFLRPAPYAGWDAWAIWNLHARALLTGGGRIWKTELFKLPWTHPDYPLLLPLTVARLWFLAGNETPAAPALVATYYTFASAGVTALTLQQLKGPLPAMLGFVTLLASNKFLWIGLQEYADVPLGFYILASFSLILLAEKMLLPNLSILAGLSAGLAAWTKNEGLTFLACLMLSYLLLIRPPAKIIRLIAGAVIPVAVTVVYKHRIPAPSDVLSWLLTRDGWSRALHWDRLAFVLRVFGDKLWRLDNWIVSSVAVLFMYLCLVGVERSAARLRQSLFALFTFVLLLVIYISVYATSPPDLANLNIYFDSSLERLYIQLWPAFILNFFLLARTPFGQRS